jgi:glutathione S-transferase
MQLYGTTTSPFVRRVRIVAAELGEPVDLVDTARPEGLEALGRVTPLQKVPVAVVDGQTLFDSRVICDHLVAVRGFGPLRRTTDDDRNVRTVADGALDSAINWFYLVRRDGADVGLPYLRKQRDRVDACLEWLAARVNGPSFDPEGGLGLAEIAVVTALDWMAFRDVWPVAKHPVLGPLAASWEVRPSFADTFPR